MIVKSVENPSGTRAVFAVDGCNLVDQDGKNVADLRGYLCARYDEATYVTSLGDYAKPRLSRIDRASGRELWGIEVPVHHKIIVRDGFVYALSFDIKVYAGKKTKFDTIVKVSGDGEVVWRWSSFEAFDQIARALGKIKPSFENKIEGGYWEYTHVNSFALDPAGANLYFSVRDQSAVFRLELATRALKLVRKFEDLQGVHSLNLKGGTLVFFANNLRPGAGAGRSGVVYYDLEKARTVRRLDSFGAIAGYSPTRGSVQPLKNEKLLISFGDGELLIYDAKASRVAYRARVHIADAKKSFMEKIYEISLVSGAE